MPDQSALREDTIAAELKRDVQLGGRTYPCRVSGAD
jgi:hypothetical protein